MKKANLFDLSEEHLDYLIQVVIPAIKNTNCNLIVLLGRTRSGKTRFCEIANAFESWQNYDLVKYFQENSYKKLTFSDIDFVTNDIVMFDEIQCLDNPLEPLHQSKKQKLLITTQTLTDLTGLNDSYLKIEFLNHKKTPIISFVERSEA